MLLILKVNATMLHHLSKVYILRLCFGILTENNVNQILKLILLYIYL